MANKQRRISIPTPTVETFTESSPGVVRPAPVLVEHAVRSELMTFDLAGQRARDLEMIRLLTAILERMSDGK